MKFESSITLLKYFVLKGTALSLICIAGVSQALVYQVTNNNDDGAGSLRAAIGLANADLSSAEPTVLFAVGGGGPINLLSSLPNITRNMWINNGNTQTHIISALPLTTINNDIVLTLLGDNAGWEGNFVNNGVIRMIQRQDPGVYPGGIDGTGNLVVDNSLHGDVTLGFSGSSTYTGTTTIQNTLAPGFFGAKLSVNANNALPTTTPLSIGGGLIFTFGGAFSQTVGSISGTGSVVFTNAANVLTVGSNNNNSTYSGVMSGGGGVTKNGTGTTTLSGTNTATGAMTINSGAIELSGGTWAGPITVNQNGTLLLTSNSVGAAPAGNNVVNGGTITNTDTTNPFNISGNFTQQATGIMNVTIANLVDYSKFAVTGNTELQAGSVMNITLLPGTTFIDRDETFDIITSANVAGPVPTVQSSSLFLNFRPSIVGANTLRLTADRTPYQDVNVVPALGGVAKALDSLIEDNKFDPVLGFVDSITSPDEYTNLLEELAPTGLNGTYIAPGAGALDQALLRLEADRGMGTAGTLARTGSTRTGYAAGDMMENQGSYGPIVFGNSTKQGSRNGLSGYNAVTGGFGFLGDVPISEYFRVGLGASYASTAVKQSDNTGSNTTIGNAQGLAYGSATYGPLFLDSVLSVGMNNYHGKHNMPLLGQTATSAYNGFQYGGKIKGGFTIQTYQVEFSPMAAVQYMHLNIGRYTQKGAGILNKNVDATKTSTVRVSLGGRIAETSQQEDFFPEIHAFYLVDVRNPDVLITSRFVAGGGSFVSKAAAPPKSGINVGASLTALISDDFVISGGYDLEAKKSFRSHSASLKFKFLF